jgi:hypothetical protein
MVRYGVMRSLAVGECTGSCDLYCDGPWTVCTTFFNGQHRMLRQKLLSCELLTISEAAASAAGILLIVYYGPS